MKVQTRLFLLIFKEFFCPNSFGDILVNTIFFGKSSGTYFSIQKFSAGFQVK